MGRLTLKTDPIPARESALIVAPDAWRIRWRLHVKIMNDGEPDRILRSVVCAVVTTQISYGDCRVRRDRGGNFLVEVPE